MSERKLTKAQLTALAALPATITMWGCKPLSSMPAGIRTRNTLFALLDRKLVTCQVDRAHETWEITPAGRLALSQDGRAE